MKKAFLLLCAALLLGTLLLPRAGYRLAEAVLSRSAASSEGTPSSASSEENGLLERLLPVPAAYTGDADVFRIQNLSTGAVEEVEKRAYLLGAVAAEMPMDWPDEALKAQAIAAHSYVLYCRDHAADSAQGWLTADPGTAAGLPDGRRAAQLLGHPVRGPFRPPFGPCGRGCGRGALL